MFRPGEYAPSVGMMANSKADYRRQVRSSGISIPRGTEIVRLGDR
jgi:hypothetical protein